MTDARATAASPHQQPNPEAYVRVVERNARGIVISGAKAIVTGGLYMHELLVMPSRNMGAEDADFAVCCGARGRARHHPGVASGRTPRREAGTRRCAVLAQVRQATAVVLFDRVRALGARVLRGRLGAQPCADLQLCHPPPPQLHRGQGGIRQPS